MLGYLCIRCRKIVPENAPCPHCNPPAEKPPADKPKQVRQRRSDAPEYELDHATISRHGNMIEIVERLVDATTRRNFDREQQYCKICIGWKTEYGEARRPRRMGAKDPTESCTGCVYGMLELVGDPGNPEDLRIEIDRVNQQINEIERSKTMRKKKADVLVKLRQRLLGLEKRLEAQEDDERARMRAHRPRVMWDREPGQVERRSGYVPLPVREEQPKPGDMRKRWLQKQAARAAWRSQVVGVATGMLLAGQVAPDGTSRGPLKGPLKAPPRLESVDG